VGLLIALAEGGYEAIHHQLQLSQFIQFTLYLEQLAWPTMSVGWTISTLQQGVSALERIDQVLTAPVPPAVISEEEDTQQANHQSSAFSLEVRHLSFQYQNPYQAETENSHRENLLILNDVSLSLKPGTLAVLVGPVGCGKTTLLNLLPRLYEVPEQTIYLEGRDITHIPIPELRQQVVLMPQHSFLFSSTVARNIAYGTPDAAQKEIIHSAEISGIHDEILGFQHQYETVVGERGILVSGGQRQRLSLARALMVSSPVLLLDDPFSNVDTETEKEVLQALDERQAFDNKLTMIATHRLSIARKADVVVLMDKGCIIATGTHEELMNTQSLYQRLNRKEQLESQLEALWHQSSVTPSPTQQMPIGQAEES
jgi:ATP-binding cassette subfamily B protein